MNIEATKKKLFDQISEALSYIETFQDDLAADEPTVDNPNDLYEFIAGMLEACRDEIVYLRAALAEIAKREGPFKIDELEFAASVIDNMATIAEKALTHQWEPKG